MYQSTKLFDGYSTVFRQWHAEDSHCKYLHGYSLEFKVTFKCTTLDHRNWVQDFGSFKDNGIKKRLSHYFDHTTCVAKDDPTLDWFRMIGQKNIIQLREFDAVGCEKFAEFVFNLIDNVVKYESADRVRVHSVECIENKKNSALYFGDKK